jgi:hypothetical protein
MSTENSVMSPIDRIVAERAIRRELLRYTRGIDRLDEALLGSTYHNPSHDDHGYYKGPGGSAYARFMTPRIRAIYRFTLHPQPYVTIDFEGMAARVESAATPFHVKVEEDGSRWLYAIGIRYVDRFELRDGKWRIATRITVHDWNYVCRIEDADLAASAAFTQGRDHPHDVSCRAGLLPCGSLGR